MEKLDLIEASLDNIRGNAPSVLLKDHTPLVVFSDLHLGNGGSNDDFLTNAGLLLTVLKDYYHKKEYTLVLNGDIEELQRFNLKEIYEYWHEAYNIFHQFYDKDRLFKLIGNHDETLPLERGKTGTGNEVNSRLLDGLRLSFRDGELFICHGHQASVYMKRFNRLAGFILKYIANPLGISNRSVSQDSRKQFKVEKRIYDYSKARKIMTLIGHTHRPLFESRSKQDTLKFEIEKRLRLYDEVEPEEQQEIEEDLRYMKDELDSMTEEEAEKEKSLYNQTIVIPSIFNSGCAIGKRGITGIEITDNRIRLVHWFDSGRSTKYLHTKDLVRLGKSDFYRKILKEDTLSYVFNKIRLLS